MHALFFFFLPTARERIPLSTVNMASSRSSLSVFSPCSKFSLQFLIIQGCVMFAFLGVVNSCTSRPTFKRQQLQGQGRLTTCKHFQVSSQSAVSRVLEEPCLVLETTYSLRPVTTRRTSLLSGGPAFQVLPQIDGPAAAVEIARNGLWCAHVKSAAPSVHALINVISTGRRNMFEKLELDLLAKN